jgi:hypothetical protein
MQALLALEAAERVGDGSSAAVALPPVLAPLEMEAMHRWTAIDWAHYKLLRYSVELVLVGPPQPRPNAHTRRTTR